MTDARRIIKSIRGIPKVPLVVTDPVDIRIAEGAGLVKMWQEQERQLDIKRQHNFEKAVIARNQQVEMIRAEKDRQQEIYDTRLKNLKKARRILAKARDL